LIERPAHNLLTFSKGQALRFTGHLDLHRAWERTLRRAEIPMAYSEGHCEERSDEAIPNTQSMNRHCEERSDEAIPNTQSMNRHCEERSDEAIPNTQEEIASPRSQ